jgi:hypothetical protein
MEGYVFLMTGGMDAAGREEKAMTRLAQAIRLGDSSDTLLARPQSIKKWIGVEMRYSRIRAVGRRARRCTAANDSGDNSEIKKKIKSLTLHSVVTPKAGDREINVEKKMVGGGEALAGMGEEETRLGRTRGLGTGGFAWFQRPISQAETGLPMWTSVFACRRHLAGSRGTGPKVTPGRVQQPITALINK